MKRHGFTLIELLVVVSIIAILSAMGLTVFTNAQRGARDARRRADMRTLQSASELYYQSAGSYPPSMSALTGAGFLENDIVPRDPKAGSLYSSSMSQTAYAYGASLEVVASSFSVGNLQ